MWANFLFALSPSLLPHPLFFLVPPSFPPFADMDIVRTFIAALPWKSAKFHCFNTQTVADMCHSLVTTDYECVGAIFSQLDWDMFRAVSREKRREREEEERKEEKEGKERRERGEGEKRER